MDQAARLSGDELAEVLRRVAPRWLAASRCVCRAWRTAIDGRGLLRADLLPLSVAGIFFHLNEHLYPEFLSSPSFSPTRVSGRLDFLRRANPNFSGDPGRFVRWCFDRGDYIVYHHCNGLLLLSQWVVNPATGRWTALPPGFAMEGPRNHAWWYYGSFLAYDPTVSPHFEVLLVPRLIDVDDDDDAHEPARLVDASSVSALQEFYFWVNILQVARWLSVVGPSQIPRRVD